MPEGGEGPRPPIIKPGRDSEGYLIKREGFPKPPAEPVQTPYKNADGSLVRFDDPDRLPTAFTRLRSSVSHAIDRFNEGFERGLDKIFGGKEPSENPTGEVVDLHGPIDDPDTLSPEDTREREGAKERHPSTGRNVEPGFRLVDPAEVEREIKDEIAGNKKPSAYDEFVGIPVEVYTAGDPKPQPDRSQPNVVDMANGAEYRELVEARELGKRGRHLRSVPDLPKRDQDDEPTPPGGSAA